MSEIIRELIKQYKEDFSRIDIEERYKWIAVKHFQDNWDIDANDFSTMLELSFSKHVNLLDAGVARPLGVLVFFAKHEPENVRSLFRNLYDETIQLKQRISDFFEGVNIFVEKMRQNDANWKSTFQDQHSISVYLTFKYPEKYYIYKFSVLRAIAPLFGLKSNANRMATFNMICDEIHDVVILDNELISINHNRLGENCYKDPNNTMLAMDIAFFAYKQQLKKEEMQELAAKPTIVADFKTWLEEPSRNNGSPYDYKTIKVYLRQTESEVKKIVPPYEGNINLFTYESLADFAPIRATLMNIIASVDNRINGAFPKVMKLYEQFLTEREESEVFDAVAEPKIVITPELPNTYNREKFLEEVYLTAENYDSLINQLIRKKNLILQGAPGVGKTYVAKRLVYSLIGEKTSERVCFVQFHQSYGYEDFVMGYRPNDTGFEMKDGAFYSFCKAAAKDPDNDWYFIIDEINRGNISRIFGELLMLIESDKRGVDYAIRLQGQEKSFFVPENVYIIGMMNTADRSIALIDYALRRRFAFYTLEPAFESEGFQDYIESKNSDKFRKIIELISRLNDEIEADPLLGSGFKIGHSYFCTDDPINTILLREIILYEMKPLLAEYWIDDVDKVNQWTIKFLEAIQ